MKKKIISLLTALVVAAGLIGVMPIASAGAYYENEFGIKSIKGKDRSVSLDSSADIISEEQLVSDLGKEVFEETVGEIREQMSNHNDSFTILFTAPTLPSNLENYAPSLLHWAVRHTGQPKEGDYILWKYKKYSCSLSAQSDSYKYNIEVTYDFTYYSTKAQENELDKKVDEIIKGLNLNGNSDYEKIVKIYDYMCENVTYDWEGLEDSTIDTEYSAYAALCENSAVCQGYSSAVYRLMLTAGIDCRIIIGSYNGDPHAWNIVKLNGKYYLLDSTADAGKKQYSRFLKGKNDFPGYDADSRYKSEEFTSNYPISDTSYDESDIPLPGGELTLEQIDINGDGKITTADVGLVNAHVKGTKQLSGEALVKADVNKDGKISTADVGIINACAKGVKKYS